MHFADQLIAALRRLGHPLCVGLDPHLDRVPELFRRGSMEPADPQTAGAVEGFLTAVVDRLVGRVAIVKPQAAFFEQLGWPGLRALAAVVGYARQRELLVLLDAKRGDVGSTAAAYGSAYLGPEAPLGVDALTVHPYLGVDSLAPLLAHARRGRGLFVLVRTSNPGAADFQDQPIVGRGALCEVVAAALAAEAAALRGPATGWSALGVVVGATAGAASERLRQILPHSLFLVPGYGAQGASARDAVRGFVAGPGGRLEGGIVNSSRAVLFPEKAATDDAGAWERAIDDAVGRAVDELRAAVGGRH